MNEFDENVDYKFIIPEDDSQRVDIQILTGEYAGVVYNYGKVSFDEDVENDQAFLNFEFDVVDDLGMSLDTHEFKTFIGDILTGILMKQMSLMQDRETYEN